MLLFICFLFFPSVNVVSKSVVMWHAIPQNPRQGFLLHRRFRRRKSEALHSRPKADRKKWWTEKKVATDSQPGRPHYRCDLEEILFDGLLF